MFCFVIAAAVVFLLSVKINAFILCKPFLLARDAFPLHSPGGSPHHLPRILSPGPNIGYRPSEKERHA